MEFVDCGILTASSVVVYERKFFLSTVPARVPVVLFIYAVLPTFLENSYNFRLSFCNIDLQWAHAAPVPCAEAKRCKIGA
jgi:hypothetical protein